MHPVVCIIQARMGSSRLPGKVLMKLAGKPMLQRLVQRLATSARIDRLFVATSQLPRDDAVADLCGEAGIACFRGDETDVLSRYMAVSAQTGARTLIRLTGDNPFVDGALVDYLLDAFEEAGGGIDYLSNIDDGGFPYGLYAEVFSADALRRTGQDRSAENREHVTWAMRRSDDFVRRTVVAPGRFRYARLTVDTADDLAAAERIFQVETRRNPDFGFRDLLEL